MTGDGTDFVARLKRALPTRWFGDSTPVLDGVLSGLAAAWSALYALLAATRLQARVATVSGTFLDAASGDYFGTRLPRRPAELDDMFRTRLQRALRREHATRAALTRSLQDLTGRAPILFEPSRVADTGAYSRQNLAYGVTGGWGSLSLPFQVFVSARRPQSTGIANIAGYGTAGPIARASLAQIAGQVSDSDIAAAVTAVLPISATAWIRISN